MATCSILISCQRDVLWKREIETADILIALPNEFITRENDGVSAKDAPHADISRREGRIARRFLRSRDFAHT